MKYEDETSPLLDHDADGHLFDPRVRTAMTSFALGDDTLALETAAAARSAAQAVERMRGQGAGNRGLSSGALDVLIRLSTAEGGVSIGELARSAGISPRNATGLLDTLERDGLAQRIPDEYDRRSVLVRITPAGQDWLTAFREPTQRAMSAMFRGFEPAELVLLRHLCLRLVENQHHLQQYLSQTGDAQ